MCTDQKIVVRDACRGDALNLAALSIQVWLHSYAIEGVRTEISRHVLSKYTEEHYCDLLDDPAYRLLVSVDEDTDLEGELHENRVLAYRGSGA